MRLQIVQLTNGKYAVRRRTGLSDWFVWRYLTVYRGIKEVGWILMSTLRKAGENAQYATVQDAADAIDYFQHHNPTPTIAVVKVLTEVEISQ